MPEQEAEFAGCASIQLPGLVAHQEVIFGSQSEGLTLRHDSYDRVSFMTGVNLGLKKLSSVMSLSMVWNTYYEIRKDAF